MKKAFWFVLAILMIGFHFANAQGDYQAKYKASLARSAWWSDARFGMFIHFGAYSLPGRGEWVKSVEKISNEDYQLYVDNFNPTDYNPREWARLAKEAGMKYAVMTAKHHDGFCLFDSKHTSYSSGKTIQRDLVREFLDAFRAEGLKVGLYYSLIDWHHPDYPKFQDPHHPMRGNPKHKNEKLNWDNYLKYMHGQVEELTTLYGKLDIMWFDFSYDEMSGEKWKSKQLVDLVRKNQPAIILNNRLFGSGSGLVQERDFYLGDFDTPEQGIPTEQPADHHGNPVPWETCLTLNNNWGFQSTDNNWKSAEMIVHMLADCVSKNGNLLLNVGPDGKGNIPGESIKTLKEVGQWMKQNGESIYGCGKTSLPQPTWGRITGKDKTVYLHWMYPHLGHLNLAGYADQVKLVTILATGSQAYTAANWWGNNKPGNYFINVNQPTYQTFPLPDPINTVIKVELR